MFPNSLLKTRLSRESCPDAVATRDGCSIHNQPKLVGIVCSCVFVLQGCPTDAFIGDAFIIAAFGCPRRCIPIPATFRFQPLRGPRMSGVGFGHRSNFSVKNRTSQTGVQRSTVSGQLATRESIPKKRNCGLKKAISCFVGPRRGAESGTTPCSLTPPGRRNLPGIVTLGANSDKSLFPVQDNRRQTPKKTSLSN